MQLWPPQLLVASCGLSSCCSHPSRQGDKGLLSACPLQPPGSVGAEQQPRGSVTDQLSHCFSLGLSALSGKWGQSICLISFSALFGGSKEVKLQKYRSSPCGSAVTNHEEAGSIPGPAQWVKDLVLLWPWCRPEVVALI